MATSKNNRRHDVDVELTLERGQVTSLIVGSVVALGAVFLVGVGVGRRLAPVPEAGAAKTEAREGTAAVPTLTFHDTLTQETVEEAVAVAPAAPAPAAKPAPEKAAPKPEKAPAPKADAEALAKTHASVAATVAALAKPAAKPEAEPKAVEKTAVATAKAATDAASETRFSVQVASSQKEADVTRLAARIKEAGYEATIVPAEIPGRGRWYRLRVGSFASREDAAMKQAELKVALDLSGMVVAI
ncbi:MAG: SPOR domain-containing protein [Deltaproteobacteria bacterium]|nr:SPOR domain-containing protein [Deltaproteobacteria bacterium]